MEQNTGGHRDASHSGGYPLVSSHSAPLSRQSLRYATLLPLVFRSLSLHIQDSFKS